MIRQRILLLLLLPGIFLLTCRREPDGAEASSRDTLAAARQEAVADSARRVRPAERFRVEHLARNAALRYGQPPHERYRAGADTLLTDGAYLVYHGDGPIVLEHWVGFREGPAELLLDLGAPAALAAVRLHALQAPQALVHYPQTVTVWVSENGRDYQRVGGTTIMDNDFQSGSRLFEITFPDRRARYLKVVAEAMAYIPSDQPGGGQAPWLLLDEVIVE